jgi:hypothetical protein
LDLGVKELIGYGAGSGVWYGYVMIPVNAGEGG